MKPLCLYGGAFDPVHNGHIYFARHIADAFKPDGLFFIPAHYSPFKGMQKYAPDDHRLKMLDIAARSVPGSAVSDIEIRREGISYTLDTLKAFHALYPENSLLWVIGDDHLDRLDRWKGYPEHFRYCDFIVLPRSHPDARLKIDRHPFRAQLHLLNADPFPVSSSEIRAILKAEGDVNSLLPDEIRDYIDRNKLYR